MKALSVEVYKSQFGNCSNGGLSSKYKDILVVCPDGNVEVDESNPPENLCKIVERDLGFTVYKHVEPVARPKGVGWMASGAIAYTCDSRFRRMSEYPLVMHDRQESVKQYMSYD